MLLNVCIRILCFTNDSRPNDFDVHNFQSIRVCNVHIVLRFTLKSLLRFEWKSKVQRMKNRRDWTACPNFDIQRASSTGTLKKWRKGFLRQKLLSNKKLLKCYEECCVIVYLILCESTLMGIKHQCSIIRIRNMGFEQDERKYVVSFKMEAPSFKQCWRRIEKMK